jgi:hypothetical protein
MQKMSHSTLQPPNGYYFIQDSCFPRQQIGKKVFFFKTFVHGGGSGCDLVKWM